MSSEDSAPPALAGNVGFSGADAGCPLDDALVPTCGRLWGTTVNPQWPDQGWQQAIDLAVATSGRAFDLMRTYHVGGDLFPTEAERKRTASAALVPFFSWKPAPQLSWADIADGRVDDLLVAQAEHLRDVVDGPFMLAVHHEPEDEVIEVVGSGMEAAQYARMYRHVIEVMRTVNGDDLVSVMAYQGGERWTSQTWFDALYPGDDVVDWIGFDPYVIPGNGYDGSFTSSLGALTGDDTGTVELDDPADPGPSRFYDWATSAHPEKPLMLAEWGIASDFGDTERARRFEEVRALLPQLPELKALVYWDAVGHPVVGTTRVDGPEATQAFRDLAGSAEVTGRSSG